MEGREYCSDGSWEAPQQFYRRIQTTKGFLFFYLSPGVQPKGTGLEKGLADIKRGGSVISVSGKLMPPNF